MMRVVLLKLSNSLYTILDWLHNNSDFLLLDSMSPIMNAGMLPYTFLSSTTSLNLLVASNSLFK